MLAAAAAAKSLQSCLTLCDPIDGGPPGSPIPGILQARTLEWVAVSFSIDTIYETKKVYLFHVFRIEIGLKVLLKSDNSQKIHEKTLDSLQLVSLTV